MEDALFFFTDDKKQIFIESNLSLASQFMLSFKQLTFVVP